MLKRLFRRRTAAQETPAGKTAEGHPQRARDEDAWLAAALENPEVSIRRQGCRKLHDLGALRRLGDSDPDAGVRELAEARYRRLLCGDGDAAPPLPERLAALADTGDPRILGHVARHGQDPQLRAAAIGSLEDPALLVECATADELAANRLAAAERVWDKGALETIAKAMGKRDKRVYRLARERLKALAEREDRPRRARELGAALCERLQRLGRFGNWEQDRAVLAHLEAQWSEIALDADAELHERFASARQRFLDEDAAQQRARADAQAERGARAAGGAEREALIARLRGLLEPQPEQDVARIDSTLSEVEQAWAQAQPAEPADAAALDQAYGEARERARALRQRLRRRAQQEATAKKLLAEAEALAAHGGPPDHRALERLQQRRTQLDDQPTSSDGGAGETPLAALDARLAELGRRLERHRRQLARKVAALPARLAEMEACLAAGELRKADPLYQSITATLEHARSAGIDRAQRAPIEDRLKEIAPQLRELRQWRRWSTDEHRAALCAEIEALAADEDHPHEPSINRLHELKAHWQALDRQGAPADDTLWQRFRAAAERVRERCRPYLDAQAALRAENRKQREALAERLEEFMAKVDWERVDWKKLQRAEREMREAWGRLAAAPEAGDGQNARDRALEGRFRRALRGLDKALAEERERNQAEKRALVERMRALTEEPDLRRAIEQAKALQQQWHTTVPARQRDENALWQAFRSACDAVFARRDAEHEARDAALRTNQSTRAGICQEVAALAEPSASDAQDPDALERRLSELKTRWHDTEALPLPRQAQGALSQQWREALSAARQRIAALREARRWDGLERLARRAEFCDRSARRIVDGGGASDPEALMRQLDQERAALPAGDEAALEDCLRALRQAAGDASARTGLRERLAENLARREMLCLHLEILAQIESPAELQSRRMELQVERLRDRMGEGDSDPGADAGALLQEWYLASPAAASPELDARLTRVKAALGGASPRGEARLQPA